MRNWFTAQELAGLDGLPGSVPGIRKVAIREEWKSQKRSGTKAIEYAFADLPAATQSAILAQAVAAVVEPVKALVSIETAPAAPAIVTPRPTTAATQLTDRQRSVMNARLSFVREIERMSGVVSQKRAIATLVNQARDGALSKYLADRAEIANDRKTADRSLSERTLKRWLSSFRDYGETGLAPFRQAREMGVPDWLPVFLSCYQRPTKPSVTASYGEFCGRYTGAVPSIHAVQRFLKKLTPEALNVGRMSPQELKALQPFKRRSTANLFPGDVYTADGHKFDAEVINPITGKPYRPEITTVLDVATRRVVGISVGESESAIGVLDALRDAVSKCMFSIFYVDNGSGFANETVREVVDRLGGTMTHSLPYNSQARGLSERGHKTIWVRAAKRLTSYIGADMDKQAGTKMHRIGRKQLRETGASRIFPTFGEFMAGVEYEVAKYNSTPHRSLPKVPGTGRHLSPDEAWDGALAEGWEPVFAPIEVVNDLMRPQVTRQTRRGEVTWAGQRYFLAALNDFHGQEIRIGYDVRDAGRVWARTLDGEMIGEALINGNSTDYMPKSMVEISREKRQQGQFKRAADKLETLTGQRVEMIAPTTAPSAVLSPDQLQIAQQYAQELDRRAPEFVVPGDDVARYRLWKRLDQRISAGEELTADEKRWWERYPSHPDFAAMQQVFQHAG